MSEIKTETVEEVVLNTIEIKREISQYFVDKDNDIIFVKVKVTKANDNSFIRWDWYNFPASEISQTSPTEATRYEDNKVALWKKINEIDEMPESTDAEIEAKNNRIGKGFKIIIGV